MGQLATITQCKGRSGFSKNLPPLNIFLVGRQKAKVRHVVAVSGRRPINI